MYVFGMVDAYSKLVWKISLLLIRQPLSSYTVFDKLSIIKKYSIVFYLDI